MVSNYRKLANVPSDVSDLSLLNAIESSDISAADITEEEAVEILRNELNLD